MLKLRRCQRRSLWRKPPVGAVLGHVAQRNGAVFIADPGPPMKKKKIASGKRAGDARRDGRDTASQAKTRTANAAEHGDAAALWS